MIIKEMLAKAIAKGEFTIESARELAATEWRSWVNGLSSSIKKDAEDLFFFIEGSVEETDEGFVSERTDPELYARSRALLEKLTDQNDAQGNTGGKTGTDPI